VEGKIVGEKTGISWTDSTFNPWWGCTKVSAGCDNCYAESLDKRWGTPHWGKGVPRRVFADKHWNEPLKWEREAQAAGVKRKVFCASMADVMDDEAPEGQRERLWELIDNTPNLIWQLLTKRPQRYKKYLPANFKHDNVWLGTSAEDQANYDLRWPILREAADMWGTVSWISYEPALGPLRLHSNLRDNHFLVPDWVICGGESGSGHRPFEQQWAEDLQAECRLYDVKFFMKQMGGLTPEQGKALIPAHLLIHEFPEVA
jgi:protein gp37